MLLAAEQVLDRDRLHLHRPLGVDVDLQALGRLQTHRLDPEALRHRHHIVVRAAQVRAQELLGDRQAADRRALLLEAVQGLGQAVHRAQDRNAEDRAALARPGDRDHPGHPITPVGVVVGRADEKLRVGPVADHQNRRLAARPPAPARPQRHALGHHPGHDPRAPQQHRQHREDEHRHHARQLDLVAGQEVKPDQRAEHRDVDDEDLVDLGKGGVTPDRAVETRGEKRRHRRQQRHRGGDRDIPGMELVNLRLGPQARPISDQHRQDDDHPVMQESAGPLRGKIPPQDELSLPERH